MTRHLEVWLNYITTADFKHFQPMNANFGLFPPLEQRMRSKKDKNEAIANRALDQLAAFKQQRINNSEI